MSHMASSLINRPAESYRRTGILFSMCLNLVLVVATVSAINLAMPDLAVTLKASNGALTWIADGYTVALAALVLPLGALGDRIGRRKVLIAGSLVFGAASLAAAFSSTTGVLIGWRLVMGVGAAMIMPGTLSTITSAFPEDQRARGVATWSGFAAAGAIIGLLVAGALLERWGWESIFVASAIVAVAAGGAAFLLSPETKEHDAAGRFDVVGSVALASFVGGLVFAIIEGNESGFTATPTVAAMVLAAAGLVTYVVAGLRSAAPLLDPRLFRLRGFSVGGMAIVVQFLAVFGFFFVGLQYLQLVLDYSPLKSAVALVPVAAVVLPISQITPMLTRRFGLAAVLTVGLGLMAAGVALLSRLVVDSGYVPFLVGLVVVGAGVGLASSTSTAAVVGSLGPDQQGVASAMNDTTREVGSAIGIAVMGSVFGSHYRASLPKGLRLLDGNPKYHEVAEAIRHSPAAGIAVSKRLGPFEGVLAKPVRVAFMDGLSASLVVVAVILVVSAVMAAVVAPRRG